ncbi:MAG: 50S ribosomal protein L18 [Candidatus Gracilibacteria bacterium]|jgi:large subunit ribosomal protein L18|nr:50S ribosomal protein L18 [Candidatus Gracilibacteria bacterium]
MLKKTLQRKRRQLRVRAKIGGTTARPRLSVFRSNSNTYAQLIDDEKGITLASIRSQDKTVASAEKAGEELAKKAQEQKITTCVFDRSGYAYHGRVKAIAEGSRKGGLKF